MKKIIPVVGMACSACSAHVEEKLKSLNGVHEASVSLLLRQATIDFDPTVISLEKIKSEVNGIGYDLIIDEEASVVEVERREYILLRRRTLLAWVFALLVMSITMRWLHLGIAIEHDIQALLALASIILCGRGFYVSAVKNLCHGRATMDTLVAFSTCVTFLISVFYHPYFDTPAMILAFVLTGRMLEERAKETTSSDIRQLMGMAPKTARLVFRDRPPRDIPIATISLGDRLEVRAGERVPTDGVVYSAESFMSPTTVYIDESMFTGEPTPVAKVKGERVMAGTVVSQGSCIVESQVMGGETALNQIITTVREALASRSPVQRVVDRVSAVFVPAVIFLSLFTFFLWWLIGGPECLPIAITSATAVAVIACPCAMGLATPTAIMVGVGRAARHHILVKDVSALETLAKVDCIVFDKTGTLTLPNPNIDFTRTEGLSFEERETLRPGAKEMVRELHAMDIEVYVASGDREEAVRHWAELLGVDHYESGMATDGKQKLVARLQQEGRTVAMVGDGINDTQALATADVSIAMQGTSQFGATSPIEISQVTILNTATVQNLEAVGTGGLTAVAEAVGTGGLTAVAEAVGTGRRTIRLVRENLFLAVVYNLVFIPMAAGLPTALGWHWAITPSVAAALMALSSLSVIANSLRGARGA